MSSCTAKWAALRIQEVIKYFHSDSTFGLTHKEAKKRLNMYGFNKLVDSTRVSPIKIFLSQFQDVMVIILIGAALLSGMLGEYADALTIFAIIILNAFLGLIQEYRAEKTIEALKKITSPTASVIREGEEIKISAEELVPGDVVLLKAGDRVPADIRLIKSMHLEVEESALTGESVPVRKDAQWAADGKKEKLAYPRNMVFMGTLVTRGKGRGIVVSTGMETEVGRIAELIQEAEETETPLQKRLAAVGKRLVVLCLVICFFVTAAGIIQGIPAYRMFLAGVSLAVAAVPEGMPAVVTIALAIGVQKMLSRRALVRKLPAVETLGCATVICSDKTGTLTKNEMTVREIWVDGRTVSVTGEGYSPRGKFFLLGKEISVSEIPALKMLLKIAVLCNNSKLLRNGINVNGLLRQKEKSWKIQGDPTEGALLVAAAKAGIWREYIEEEEERLGEIPFDSDRKCMSVVYNHRGRKFIYVKAL
ncbi:MAG: ATPase, P-type (Transporting), HAD superfamily, subfamily IC [Clostridia bacterium 41_269]|nr:MAG: ATPase, P-type (Transporting), HAD superfamily, subfamily IC [Clostridia bacterium 41_269]